MHKHLLIAGLFTAMGFCASSQTDTAIFDSVDLSVHIENMEVDGANRAGMRLQERQQVYTLKPKIDIPLTAAGTAWTLYGFSVIYSKDRTPHERILALDANNLNGFDRWAADVYSEKAAETSDLLFYGSMPLPLVLLLDKHARKDFPKLGFLYLEAMAITGVLYTGSAYIWDRFRPLAYNPEVPIEQRASGGSKNSFFAGHVALVGTSTFFVAKVLSDYHPDSKANWVWFSAASVATGATAYLRHRGGKHFPSDIVIGTAVGTLSGILVPHFHKNRLIKNDNITLAPFSNGVSTGATFVYRF